MSDHRRVDRHEPVSKPQPARDGVSQPLNDFASGMGNAALGALFAAQRPVQSGRPLDRGPRMVSRDFDAGLPSPAPPANQPPASFGPATPHPRDPYEHPPTNWDQLTEPRATPPALGIPQPWPAQNLVAATPRGWCDVNGGFVPVTPQQDVVAEQSTAAFRRDYDAARAAWTSLLPAVHAYNHANEDLANGGVLSSVGGLGWQGDPAQPTDMASLTAAQRVGPNDERSVGSVFEAQHGASAVKQATTSARANHATRQAVVEINDAQEGMREVEVTYRAEISGAQGAVEAVHAALRQTNGARLENQRDEHSRQREQVAGQREHAIHQVEVVMQSIEALILLGWGIADGVREDPSHGAESVMIGLAIAAEVAAREYQASRFDAQLERLAQQIHELQRPIGDNRAAQADHALQAAFLGLRAAQQREHAAYQELRSRRIRLQGAYDRLGQAAGAAVGGGAAGANLEAVIEAVPRVQQCLAVIQTVLDNTRVPRYTELSGRGFNGYSQPADFVEHVRSLKQYRLVFEARRQQWTERLVSLNALVARLGAAPSTTSRSGR